MGTQDQGSSKSIMMSFRTTVGDLARLDAAAKARGISRSDLFRLVLEDAIKESMATAADAA